MQKKHFLWLLISLGLTFICLSPNLSNNFLDFDDPDYVINNPLIRDFSFQGIKNIFNTERVVGTYSPIVIVFWTIDYAISGLNPITFHLTSILMHMLVVVLVFYLAFLLSKRIEVAFIASILFGIHPMHVGAVSWISSCKDIMYTLFFIAGLIAYYFYVNELTKYPRWYYFIISILLYVLSLFSKGTAVTFPLILLLFDYLAARKDYKRIVLEKIPFLLLSVVFVMVAIHVQKIAGAMEDRIFVSFWDSISVGFYGYFTYLIKSIVPFHLSSYHPYPNVIGTTNPWYFYASAIPVLLLFIGTVINAKKYRLFVFGVAFFFITLIPVIQVMPFGSAVTADRYTYLPYFGLFFLFGLGIITLLDRVGRYRNWVYIIGASYFLLLGVVSFGYAKIFKNSETFWSRVIKVYPDDFLGYMNRGSYRVQQGHYIKALEDLNHGMTLNNTYYWLPYNRALAYNGLGKYEDALMDYNKSIALDPKYTSSFLNRGIIYNRKGDFDKAIADFSQVIRLDSKAYKAYYNRALSNKKKGAYPTAIEDLSIMISLGQLVSEGLVSRGEVYTLIGQKEQAFADFDQAIRLDPNMAKVYTKRGTLYFDIGKYAAAEKDFRQAIRLDQNQLNAYINLGVILMNQSRFKEGLQSFNAAQKLAPNDYLIYYNRGLLLQLSGNYNAAITDFNECLQLKPDFMSAIRDREKIQQVLDTK
ncbi:tetratricopeptide repeat protein [uncultured Aquimarina sp.]|uniref:tetratricopeptide repeat protein n=1 Tax=uncultured Aquimarina sp. TaxID=575652 RepID=UPI00261CEDA0|nr:tetratricopeptide repeat protein [uncultured Aquimarina sp.]